VSAININLGEEKVIAININLGEEKVIAINLVRKK
jgi:hypothetical protein